jgi:virginiamycin B lyase
MAALGRSGKPARRRGLATATAALLALPLIGAVPPLAAASPAAASRASAAAPSHVAAITIFPAKIDQPSNILDSHGIMWFVNRGNNSIGELSPGHAIRAFAEPNPNAPQTGSIAAGTDGDIWFTEYGAKGSAEGSIDRISPTDVVKKFRKVGMGHPVDIARSRRGSLWFTSQTPGIIGRITTRGTIRLFHDHLISNASSLTAGADGAMWFDNHRGRALGRISPDGKVTDYDLRGSKLYDEAGPIAGPGHSVLFVCNNLLSIARFNTVTKKVTIAAHLTAGTISDLATGSGGAIWFVIYGNPVSTSVNSIGRVSLRGKVTIFQNKDVHAAEWIARGSHGAMWFTNYYHSIGRITSAGKVTTFSSRVDGPADTATGADGSLWFTNHDNNTIGRIKPDGSLHMYSHSNPSIYSPGEIAAGSGGAMWFTPFSDSIGRITSAGSFRFFTARTIHHPVSIAAGSDGSLWFTNNTGNGIGHITNSGVVTNYTDPGKIDPYDITAGPDGAMWFTNPFHNSIGRIADDGTITTFADPSVAYPFGITAGPDDALWFTNHTSTPTSTAGSIGRITTGGVISSYPIGTLRFPASITAGPDGALWFLTANSMIGRISTAGRVSSFRLPGTHHAGITIRTGRHGALWVADLGDDLIARITTSVG